jgi:hypothetical protein
MYHHGVTHWQESTSRQSSQDTFERDSVATPATAR